MLDQHIDATNLYPIAILIFIGSAELGMWIGRRCREQSIAADHMGILSGSALGLFALLLAFSLSHALSRYEIRRDLVVQEADSIRNAAHLTLMLPEETQAPMRS